MRIKLLITFLFISIQTFAQTPNIGFEDGTFHNWKCFVGKIDSSGSISVEESIPVPNRHTIIDKNTFPALDPYGGFPVLCPNGSKYCVRLGNNIGGAQAERLSYTLVVPDQKSYSIVFNYAVVLENPGHEPYQQPRFTAVVYDVTDDEFISCPAFDFTSSSSLPGFKLSAVEGYKGDAIFYKDWSTATIDLSHYAGKTISILFTTNDCTFKEHFGYAYIDVNEDGEAAITGNTYCAGQPSATLYAPNGFKSYEWYNADMTQKIGDGQSLKLSPPPADNTTYAVKVFPYPELGCVDVLYTTVKKIDEGFRLKVVDTVFGCPAEGADITQAQVTPGTTQGAMLSYFNDELGTSYLYEPAKIFRSGTYYIKGMNTEGCMNMLPIQVLVSQPRITTIDPPPVDYPVLIDLTTTFAHRPELTYSYYKDAAATVPLTDYAAIHYGGIYYIKASMHGCDTIAAVNVVIHPPPPYEVNSPNAFTPNNDGINDHFALTLKGFVSFTSLKIFNRNGQLVFNTNSIDKYWDGTLAHRQLPTGVYYWLFEGTDMYKQTKVNLGGYITLLR